MKEGGVYHMEGGIDLTEEDLQIFTGSREGYVCATDHGITVSRWRSRPSSPPSF